MTQWLPRRLFLVRGAPGSAEVCITFDDGPHPVHTPAILDILRIYQVRASFFVVGRYVDQYPHIVKCMVEDGHLVGHHSYWHGEPGSTSCSQLMSEVRRTVRSIRAATGTESAFFRPPHGKLSPAKLIGLWMKRQTVVLWTADPRDYSRQSAAEIEAEFAKKPVTGGDILLLHDNVALLVQALPYVIESTKRRGLKFARVSDWIA